MSPDTLNIGPFASTWDRLPGGVREGMLQWLALAAALAAHIGVCMASSASFAVLLPAHVRKITPSYGKTAAPPACLSQVQVGK